MNTPSLDKKPPIAKRKPYTYEELTSGAFYFQCVGNKLFLGVAATPDKWLQAIYTFPDAHTLFQLIPGENKTVQLYSCYHKSIVSAVGAGWALLPTVRDVTWSKFVLIFDAARGTIRLRSTQPIAQATPYVTTIGTRRIAQIAMARPEDDFGEFIVFSADEHAKQISTCIKNGRYHAKGRRKSTDD